MPNTKKIIGDWSETGKTVYCIIRQESTNYLLNSNTGTFSLSPSAYCTSMPENSVIKGRYELSESRSVWSDGVYTVVSYKQTGGSPSPLSDTIIGSGELDIINDTEVVIGSISSDLSFLKKWIINKLVESPDGTTVTLYDDDNTTPIKTWTIDDINKIRYKGT